MLGWYLNVQNYVGNLPIMANVIVIHNNRNEYTPEELFNLQQAGEKLLVCEQGKSRTLEETRIMVAFKRLKHEGNFKITVEKPPKAVKERKPKKLTKKNFLLLDAKILEGEALSVEEEVDYNHSLQFWSK